MAEVVGRGVVEVTGEFDGTSLTRDIDGRLRDARGRFAAEGQGMGQDLGAGVQSGFGKSFQTVMTNVGTSLSTAGEKVTDFGQSTLKATAPVLAFAGTALFTGFKRLAGIEQAEASLRGLGHSAEEIERIMTNAENAVLGTAFSLDQAAGVAATAISSGVKPGQELERTLTLVADAATIAGTDMTDMGGIFNDVAATGRVTADVINQLADRNINAVAMLADQMGVTQSKVREMVSAGKVDFATFQDAMEQGLGGAALEAGQTVTGSINNLMAAIARLGAAFLGASFESFPEMIGQITVSIDGLRDKIEPVGTVVSSVIQRIFDAFASLPSGVQGAIAAIIGVVTAVGLLALAIGPVISALGAVVTAIGSVSLPVLAVVAGVAALAAAFGVLYAKSATFRNIMAQIGGIISGTVVPAVQALWSFFATKLLPIITKTASTVASNLKPVLDAVSSTLQSQIAPAIAQVAAKFQEWWPTIQKVIVFLFQVQASIWKFYSVLASVLLPILIRVAGFMITGMVRAVMLVASVLGGIIKVVRTVGSAIGSALSAGVSRAVAVFNLLRGAVRTVINAFVTVVKWIANVVKRFTPLGAALGAARVAFTALARVVTRTMGQVRDTVVRVTSAVVNRFQSAWQSVKSVTSRIFGSLVAAVTGPLGRIRTAVSTGVNRIKELFSNAWGAIRDGAARGLSNVVTAIGNGVTNAVNKVKDLGTRLRSAVSGIDLYSAGANLMTSFVNGIASKVEAAVSKVRDAAGKIKKLLPGSPIKEGPLKSWNNGGAGKRLMEMLADGIAAGAPSVGNALEGALSPFSKPTAAPLASQLELSRARGGVRSPLAQTATNNVHMNFFGPTTSGGRLAELEWTLRYATAVRQENVAGVPA